jgi:hypothetical protein
MFSWATSTFAKLSETVAPPATDGASRFVYCCQRGDEEGAIACVPEIPGAGCIVNNAKGQVPLHLACLHSMPKLIRVLLNEPGASLDVPDAAGNTPLHCACMSNNQQAALDTVKMMIQECGSHAHVTAKNGSGQTPYDVAVLNSVRQYLLPIQLQQETQQAIDNGGAGLPPGIDMGGLKIDRSHLPPPPMGGPGNLGGAPASPYVTTPLNGGGHGPPSSGGANYPHSTGPASGGGGGYHNNGPSYGGAAPMTPGVPAQGASAMPASPYQSQSAPNGGHVPPMSTPQPPPAPSSGASQHAYSRNGSSSAAFYQPTAGSGRNFVKPDGFHSSSSDKNLQQKYGHSAANGTVSAIPPPPSSSGSSYSTGGPGQVQSSPGSLNNPYSRGGVTRSAKGRYPTYDPITGQQMTPPAPSSGGYNGGGYGAPGAGMGPMPTPTNFNTFNPAAAQQPAGAAPSPGQGYGYASSPAAASPAAPGGYGFNAPSPGSQNRNGFNAAGSQAAASPVSSSSMSDFPPPPIPRHMQGPAATFAAPPAATEPSSMKVSASSPAQFSSPRSQPIASPRSAEQVFGARPQVEPSPAKMQQPEPTAPAPVPAQGYAQDPAGTFAAPPAATEPTPMEISAPSPSQAFSSPRSQPIASPKSAEQVFGARPQVEPSPAKMQQPEPTAPAPVPAQGHVQVPAATFVAPPAATEQPPLEVSSPPPVQSFSSPRSQPIASPRSAEQVFGTRPQGVPSPMEMQVTDPTTTAPPAPVSTMDSAASASELFSKPAASPITIVEDEDSLPARPSDLVLKRTSTEDSSTSTASDVFAKRPNDFTLATDVFSKPVEAVGAVAAAPPQAQPEQETVPSVQEVTQLVLDSTSYLMPHAIDVSSEPMKAVDAFATAPPLTQPEPETVPPVQEVTEPVLESTATAAPQATDVFSKPQERAAADAFASGPPQAHGEQETTSPAQEESGESVPEAEVKREVIEESTGAGEEHEEDMTDVPLSPYRDEQEVDPATRAPPPIEPDNSLFSAIGMPPPPFTKKY